uniref:G_PROTEIN_RECEP_F1_2 domain-containing protein n=1 Tax=Caenorhabditis tropicalis TaxID=1561998 RepID=A0A1I7TY94_9PELO
MKKAAEFVLENMKISLNNRAFLGFSLEIQKSDCLFFVFIFNMLILFLILLCCILLCANRIIRKVSSDLSNRNHYSSIYRLLMVQCVSPTLFTIFPCTFNMVTGIFGIDLGEVIPFILATLLPMYPAVNTFLIIWQIRDYRNYLFCCIKHKKRNSVMVLDRRKSTILSL